MRTYNLKKIISLICITSLLLIFCIPSVNASSSMTLSIADVVAQPGEDVQVPMVLTGNSTGVLAMQLSVSYDSRLTLKSITKGEALPSLTLTPPGDLSANPCTILNEGLNADVSNGTVVILTFTAPEVAGEFYIKIPQSGIQVYDDDVNEIDVTVVNGSVIVPTSGNAGSGGGGSTEDTLVSTFTRGSFCQEIVDTFAFDIDTSAVECPWFDIDETNENYGAILTCFELGFVRGHADGSFRAENNVTNAEIAKIIYDVLSYIDWDVEIPEDADYDKTVWHGMYSWYAENAGIMENISDWDAVANEESLGIIFSLIGDAYQKHIYDLENPDSVPKEYELVVGENDVTIDDRVEEYNYAPILVNNAVYWNIRALGDVLGIGVCWDNNSKQAIFGGWNNIISFTLGDGNCVLIDAVTYVNAEYLFEKILGDDYNVTADDTRLYAVKIDETSAQFKVNSSIGVVGHTVKVPVEIKNNPGISSVQLKISYDNQYLTLLEVNDMGILGDAKHSDNISLNPYILMWENDTVKEAITNNGNVVELVFEVADDTPVGKYDIIISYDEVLDLDGEFVDFKIANGVIDVIDYIIGDVNGDGEFNTKDRMTLSRHLAGWIGYDEIHEAAADVNCDGVVNTKDRFIISRHIAHWIGYETLPYIK